VRKPTKCFICNGCGADGIFKMYYHRPSQKNVRVCTDCEYKYIKDPVNATEWEKFMQFRRNLVE
jgi:hypothetical protein